VTHAAGVRCASRWIGRSASPGEDRSQIVAQRELQPPTASDDREIRCDLGNPSIGISFASEIYGSRPWTAELVAAASTVRQLISAFLPRRAGEPVVFHVRLPPPAHRLCTCEPDISGDVSRPAPAPGPPSSRSRNRSRRAVLACQLLSKSSEAAVVKCGRGRTRDVGPDWVRRWRCGR
jgi:hypothetical protein